MAPTSDVGSSPPWERTVRVGASRPMADLEQGRTGDPLWDAAQRGLLRHGVMHNNVRMTWGKATVRWLDPPEMAMEQTLAMNDRYALDGRDASSIAGVQWCFGLFDRPFEPFDPRVGHVRRRPTEDHAAHRSRPIPHGRKHRRSKPVRRELRPWLNSRGHRSPVVVGPRPRSDRSRRRLGLRWGSLRSSSHNRDEDPIGRCGGTWPIHLGAGRSTAGGPDGMVGGCHGRSLSRSGGDASFGRHLTSMSWAMHWMRAHAGSRSYTCHHGRFGHARTRANEPPCVQVMVPPSIITDDAHPARDGIASRRDPATIRGFGPSPSTPRSGPCTALVS